MRQREIPAVERTVLRQHFWKQYDADDTGALSNIELTSMLDSLRSTLSTKTVNSFTCNGKKPFEDELTVHEAIWCLEENGCSCRGRGSPSFERAMVCWVVRVRS
jgi:hypothetical protein